MSISIILHPHSVELVDPEYVEKIKNNFQLQGFSKLESFLSPTLLKMISEKLPYSKYHDYDHPYGKEEVANSDIAHILNFALNQPKLLQLLSSLVGVELEKFTGRQYRYRHQHSQLEWHKDYAGHLAISINIFPEFYLGGNLEFKPFDQKNNHNLITASNKIFGDAIIFPTQSKLIHRVLPVTEGFEKVAFAGWFS